MTGPILLPSRPGLRTDTPTMMDWGGALTPPNGGATQTLLRLGTRHALDFTVPMMPTEPLGRQWAATLKLAKLYGALLPFGQDGFRVGPAGTPVVDGAGQSGSVLNLRGFTPSYAIRLGQYFSLVHNGRRYIHFAAASVVAVGGVAVVPIAPMLRILPDDADICEFGKPMIQGSISGNKIAQTRQTAPWSDFGTITIVEDE